MLQTVHRVLVYGNICLVSILSSHGPLVQLSGIPVRLVMVTLKWNFGAIMQAGVWTQSCCAVQGYPILNLFLLANLMTTTSTLPVLLGLLDGRIASRLFTPLSALFGCWFSFAAIVVYGRIMLADWGGSMSDVSHLPRAGPAPLQ